MEVGIEGRNGRVEQGACHLVGYLGGLFELTIGCPGGRFFFDSLGD
jgi:hypothetical protein